MKKLRKIFTIAVFMLLALILNVKAASISGNTDVYVGDTVTLTFDFGVNIAAYDSINISYDTSILEYVSGDSLNETVWWDETQGSQGIREKTYVFRAISQGSTKVMANISGAVDAGEGMDELGTISAEKLVNVSIKKDEPQIDNNQNTGNTNVVSPSSPTANGNNYLRYLQISEEGLTPNFTKNITDYSLAVGENVNSIEVLARPEDPNATVEITGNENIVNGENYINIKVTAENGYYRIYTITVTKTNNKETSNAYLQDLIIENYELDKAFQSEILEYDIGEVLSTVDKLNIIATAKDSNAKIEIIGADNLVDEGQGEITIKVTAPDGTTTKEYKIKYTVKQATADEILDKQIQDHLKEIQDSKTKKEIVLSYLKYIWSAIKKNYLLILMYLLILIEFIQIIVLRRKLKKANSGDDDNNPPSQKDILKIDVEDKKDELPNPENLDPPQINNMVEGKFIEPQLPKNEEVRLERKGSLEKNTSKADGIKLVDLDKDEGPQDELTFNIFENLTDEDIKKMLDEQIENEK